MRISLIAAMTGNRLIGRDGTMPWHLPADLQRFKKLTMGKPIIMGRKTFQSLGRILPGRRHIVISRQDLKTPGVEVVGSLDAALQTAAGEEEVFVIGGGEIFRQALPRADRMYITMIDADLEGDVYFPSFDMRQWREVERIERVADAQNPYGLILLVLERARSA